MNNAITPQTTAMTQGTISFNMFMSAENVQKKVNQIIGGKEGQKFITSIVAAVQNNPSLQECDNKSIFTCALLGASLKLSPSPQLGQFYMVPFNDKTKGKVAQFIIGYKGYIQLAIRSGYYKDIDVIEVREGEYLGRNQFTGKHQFNFIEDEVERETKNVIGYMAFFEYLNGFSKQIYWSKDKMLKHADKYVPSFNLYGVSSTNPKKSKVSYQDFINNNYPNEDAWKYSSYWYQDFDGMAFKTLLRQLISKWGIMSIEMQTAYENDDAFIHEDGSKEYLDNDTSDLIIPQDESTEQEPENINQDQTKTENKEQASKDGQAPQRVGIKDL